ncbi:hypothetical protein SAMN05444972_1113 [Marininema halotolerans]|uniref:Uncharacterized protein n=1 Tax=Marininema halotolerans TaxID=1155944 RepID=A0A1I6TR94_9BACL|nr:hypothetical protein SAMN05444972_1113 [Marininema halotolerans]
MLRYLNIIFTILLLVYCVYSFLYKQESFKNNLIVIPLGIILILLIQMDRRG